MKAVQEHSIHQAGLRASCKKPGDTSNINTGSIWLYLVEISSFSPKRRSRSPVSCPRAIFVSETQFTASYDKKKKNERRLTCFSQHQLNSYHKGKSLTGWFFFFFFDIPLNRFTTISAELCCPIEWCLLKTEKEKQKLCLSGWCWKSLNWKSALRFCWPHAYDNVEHQHLSSSRNSTVSNDYYF